MKKYLILLALVVAANINYAQQNKGLCNVVINDVSKTISFGYLIGYVVQFKNNTKKSVDGIYWTTNFYNNAGKLIKSEESSFNSTNLIDPIASGFTKSVVRSPRVKGASKVEIVINKVHFSEGASCK